VALWRHGKKWEMSVKRRERHENVNLGNKVPYTQHKRGFQKRCVKWKATYPSQEGKFGSRY